MSSGANDSFAVNKALNLNAMQGTLSRLTSLTQALVGIRLLVSVAARDTSKRCAPSSKLIPCFTKTLGLSAHGFAVPIQILRATFAFNGKRKVCQRLGGARPVKTSSARNRLDWTAAVDEGLRQVAQRSADDQANS